MPSSVSGLTGSEIITLVQNYVGDTSSGLTTFLTYMLPLAESRYCKSHAWSFLRKQNLSLTVVSGTNEYTLSVANIGYYISAQDVETIFSTAAKKHLVKTDLQTLRQVDPDINDGSTSQYATHWAPTTDNKIILHPPTFQDTTLKVDGLVRPVSLYTASNYPTVPQHYQDSFVCYVQALALDRGNDDRAPAKKAEALDLIRRDIQDDLKGLGDIEDPRVKSEYELVYSRANANLDQLFNPLNM